jgi:hypothetical protein
MATLHIEHGITEFSTWKAAFDRFAEKRREAGVTAHRIHQPYNDAAYVVLQLDFPSVEQAQEFRRFLETGMEQPGQLAWAFRRAPGPGSRRRALTYRAAAINTPLPPILSANRSKKKKAASGRLLNCPAQNGISSSMPPGSKAGALEEGRRPPPPLPPLSRTPRNPPLSPPP